MPDPLPQIEIEIMAARQRASELTTALTICSNQPRMQYLTDALHSTEEHIRKLIMGNELDELRAEVVRLQNACAERDAELLALHAAYARLTDERAAYERNAGSDTAAPSETGKAT